MEGRGGGVISRKAVFAIGTGVFKTEGLRR